MCYQKPVIGRPKTALRAGRIYSATQNNGRITQRKNWLSGEVVTYTYDSLQRLTQATATGPSPWSESYTFDGFGNLTGKAGSNWVVNASTNRINGLSYDANGNQANGGSSAYDIDNRLLTWDGTEQYRYDPSNKRVFRRWTNGIGQLQETYSMYGVNGKVTAELAAVYDPAAGVQPGIVLTPTATYQYVGTRKVGWNEPVEDRLGTKPAGSGRPYGENVSQYATHQKDATGLHYADQRYYSSSWGRFMTADPYRASGGASDPGSWNRYSYVGGDPVNFNDPAGLMSCWVERWVTDSQGTRAHVMCFSNDGLATRDGWFNSGSPSTKEESRILQNVASIWRDLDVDRDWDLMPAALDFALSALSKRKECVELFGNADTRQGRWNPETVLRSMFERRSNEYGTVDFEYTDDAVAQTTPAGFPLPSINQGITGSRANIHFNRRWWNVGNAAENAETLLHELGHLYNFTRGSGGFALPNRAELTDDRAFDKLIKEKCNLP